ncbi:MBL fold hydrolase [Halobacteriales archaeon QH_8_64_26]|nr:MAG: MBL fold hydrolase [Halobacteriales archaeon QH_8_64_26]
MTSIARVPLSVETRAPGGETNAYVLGENEAVLLDPAARSPELDSLVDVRGVAHLLVTHTHPDHVGGVAEYASRTDATVWAHADHRDRFVQASGIEPDRAFENGTRIGGENGDATVLETPGHAPDHVSLATDEGILVGDLAVATGSVAITAGEGHVGKYLDSLRRLYGMGPEKLFPGHGPVIDGPRDALERLIEHRLEREEQVLAAVRGGAHGLGAITDAAYEKDVSSVRDLAERTVAAHLEQLAREGEMTWDGERAEPL